MKKLLIPFGLLLLQIPMEAQILRKIEQSAKRATDRVIERKTEEKVEEAAENIFDSIFSSKKENKQDTAKATTTNQKSSESKTNETDYSAYNIFGGGDAKFEDSYSFNMNAVIQIEEFGKDANKMELTQGYGKDCLLTLTEETEGPMIMDFKNKSALMVNEKEKVVQAFSLDMMDKFMKKQDNSTTSEDYSDIEITKTGKSKKILGYTSYEYIMISDGDKMISWHAPDLEFNYMETLGSFMNNFDIDSESTEAPPFDMPQGYLMEMTMFNSEGKKENHYEVISISENVKTIDLKGFSVQKF
jgi:hypothetical protein